MKHITALFAFSLFIFTASAAVPLKWTVETSRAVPAQFEAYQGETLSIEAALQSYGKPLEAPLNYSLYWQTNGMGNAWWSTNCNHTIEQSEQSNNVLRATWTPSMETGAKVYNCFIGKPGTIYHAAFQLRLRPSPGATPNELPLPQKVIDFAKVTVINPPWSGGGGGGVDTNAVREIAREEITPATNAVNVAMTNRYTKAETDAKLSPIDAQIAAIQGGKRDKTDEDAYKYTFSAWSYTSDDQDLLENFIASGQEPRQVTPGVSTWEFNSVGGDWYAVDGYAYGPPDTLCLELEYFHGTPPPPGDKTATVIATRTKSVGPDLAHKLAKRTAAPASGSLAKFDEDGNLVSATGSDIPHDDTKFDKSGGTITDAVTFCGKVDVMNGGSAIDVWSSPIRSGAIGFGWIQDDNRRTVQQELDAKRDRTDNEAHEGSASYDFSEQAARGGDWSHYTWSVHYGSSSGKARLRNDAWDIAADSVETFATQQDFENATVFTWGTAEFPTMFPIEGTKTYCIRYAATGESFVTHSFVMNAAQSAAAAAVSTNNPAFVSAVLSIAQPSSPSLRIYDEIRQCWWIGRMVNGVINWEVE